MVVQPTKSITISDHFMHFYLPSNYLLEDVTKVLRDTILEYVIIYPLHWWYVIYPVSYYGISNKCRQNFTQLKQWTGKTPLKFVSYSFLVIFNLIILLYLNLLAAKNVFHLYAKVKLKLSILGMN